MIELLAPPEATVEIEALLERRGLTAAAAAVAYFSFESPQSFIAARDPDGTITPLIGFFPLPVRGAQLLQAIASIDENGPRLMTNYERAFPELVGEIRAFGSELKPVESESLGWLLAASSLVLGMKEEDVARALGPIPELVTVDTVVVEQPDASGAAHSGESASRAGEQREGRYVLDSRRLLRSVMSYRIAAVPSHVLARSVFESLGDYAANAVRRLLRDWKVEVVVCAGDLFARNRFIADRARRGLVRPKLQVYFPPPMGEA
jgi:hypothetical protein